MGIGKFFDPRNMRQMIHIAKVSDGLDKHMTKSCAYCNLKMGLGDTYPVIEFLEHLVARHPEKIDAKDVETYRKVIEKLTK